MARIPKITRTIGNKTVFLKGKILEFGMSMLLDKNSQLTSLSLRYEIMAQNYWMFSVFILTAVTGIALVIGEV